ncbi:MAG: uridine kinase [Clostridiales bacterium]|nr:uridine kinase [Clostridiales bacterium]
MIIIGICGASGSGKSTLAKEIKNSLDCETVIIGQDCYYKDQSYKPFEERVTTDYDDPEIFDYKELIADMNLLAEGKPITKKGYDYANHVRADSTELIQPPDVVILEGIHVFYDQELMDRMSLKVYMHVDPDMCLLRRMLRDTQERGREIKGVAKQYVATVKPWYDEVISKYIRRADFAVMHGGRNQRAIDAISAYITVELWAEKRGK